MIYQGSKRYAVNEIAVHCSATRPDWMAGATSTAKVEEIRRWHRANGWNDIGYHWIIDRDGTLKKGREENVIGAGILGRNNGVIHVCLIGGHGSSATDNFFDHFSVKQDQRLRRLIEDIRKRTVITKVSGHNEYANKACPGFTVRDWL